MRDRYRANKNESQIFVFCVTSHDFPHDMLLLALLQRKFARHYGSRPDAAMFLAAALLTQANVARHSYYYFARQHYCLYSNLTVLLREIGTWLRFVALHFCFVLG